MKTLISVGALALFGLVQPAAAQMCAPGQQAQASTPATGGMMCGMARPAADDPMADTPAQPQQQSGMCPCCRNIAMMRGGMQGQQAPQGQGSHQGMPGMQHN